MRTPWVTVTTLRSLLDRLITQAVTDDFQGNRDTVKIFFKFILVTGFDVAYALSPHPQPPFY